jgi:starch phosphorylase
LKADDPKEKQGNGTAFDELIPATPEFQGTDIESIKTCFTDHLAYSLAKHRYTATQRDFYDSLALTVRDRLIDKWIKTQETYYRTDVKRVYYLSMEYLIGRLLSDAINNLGLCENINAAMKNLGLNLRDLSEMESDAGLGNGGLGRLAACFMDSMATLELPAYGYGIRYEYGIFYQKIVDGYQLESPDHWLRYGNPWEIERPEYIYPIKFYGKINTTKYGKGQLKTEWTDTEDIIAMPYDTPIPGFHNNTVNNLRLWSARASREFNLDFFNSGNYGKAVEDKIQSELLSKVLYPRDDFYAGRELRLKQEYFLVSASLQDIIRRFKATHKDGFKDFPQKVAIQMNDTHPVLAIPELMRLLIDNEGFSWNDAWDITINTFGYTNHTVLPEALEKWRIQLMEYLLPRHMQIIYEINSRWLDKVRAIYPGDLERLKRVSIIEEGKEKRIRMAHLAIVGSHSVNGVAELHTQILKNSVFKEFYDIWPEKFNNKTNGITPRRWLKVSNPRLSKLISSKIGEDWITDLYQLEKLVEFVDDPEFHKEWTAAKRKNKEYLASCINKYYNLEFELDSIFDVQVKRIHEYKRQLLNALHIIVLYNRIKENPDIDMVPRTIILGGKAAPSYDMAKLIIKLINSIADVVNNDPQVGKKLRVVFLANYNVTPAQLIIPAADLSEQISTAGMEASGTGNMKFALNGALTIGTLDGANIEIKQEVGEENVFIFGLKAEEVIPARMEALDASKYYNQNPELAKAVDLINNGFFSPSKPKLFVPIIDSILQSNDYYMVFRDFDAYIRCQDLVSQTYLDQEKWTKMSILNVAHMGKFSSDRTIREYARDIWNVNPISIEVSGSEKLK